MSKKDKTTPTAKSGGRLFRNDFIFIIALLLVVSALGLGFYLFRGEGNTVIVTVDKKEVGRYPLSKDTTVEIRTGKEREELNLLVIKDGKAYVETATCPDGICAEHKPISREGESIVCLPHKVVITIDSTETNEEPDIIL